MVLSKCSVALVLDLIEDRINQLDALLPSDADDLQILLRCREELKVTALTADLSDRGAPTKTAWHSDRMARHQISVPTAPAIALDVI